MARDLVKQDRRVSASSGIDWSWAAAIARWLWVLFVFAELVDVGVGNTALSQRDRVRPRAAYGVCGCGDADGRAAGESAVLGRGIAAPMRYYYFWYVLTAVAARLGRSDGAAGVDRQRGRGRGLGWRRWWRFIAGIFWKRSERRVGLHAAALVARGDLRLGLLAVTGLDILPAIAKALLRMPADADMEWWSQDQVDSWMDSVLWVPHHVAGLVCCLLGFLLVWMAKGECRTAALDVRVGRGDGVCQRVRAVHMGCRWRLRW